MQSHGYQQVDTQSASGYSGYSADRRLTAPLNTEVALSPYTGLKEDNSRHSFETGVPFGGFQSGFQSQTMEFDVPGMDAPVVFPLNWKMGFFIAAVMVIASGCLGAIYLALLTFKPVDCLNSIYAAVLGMLMCFVDVPLENEAIVALRYLVYKYFLFLTRFIGRGVFYIFLATLVIQLLWNDNISPFFAVIFGTYIFLLGVAALFYGVTKTLKVDGFRQIIINCGRNEIINPVQEMTGDRFNAIYTELTGNSFSKDEMGYLLNALSLDVKADSIISVEEWNTWVRAPRLTIL